MKILMVGLGGIGQRHLRNLRTLLGAEAEILAYRVRRQSPVLTDQLQVEAGSDLEEKYDIKVFGDLDQALDCKPAAVFVCNPSSMHIPIALAAARAGCHLFIEKPLSHNLDEIDTLIQEVQSRKLVAMVGYQMRFHPCLEQVKLMLLQEVIGRVLAVRIEVGEYLPSWHAYEDYRIMYAARKELGGGVILSQIHEMDYIYWLFGLPSRIFALGGHLSTLRIDVEDVAAILMESMVNRQFVPIEVHLDYVQRPPARTCQVIGDQGKIEVDLRAASLRVFDNTGAPTQTATFPDFERNQMFINEMEYFLGCVEGRWAPKVSLRDGRQSLKMALAAKESLETGKIVTLARDE